MNIGPFEILDTLGGGGSGIVYRARNETLPTRIVAVKQLNRQVRAGDRAFERFEREARMMASIRSDHVVTLYSYQVVDGRPLLEMECLESGSLESRMNGGPIDVGAALEILDDILLGLKALHGAGIVHRDVKPANVLQDESGRYKLTDFGLSVVENEAKPTLEAATIRYVAPECIAENPSCDFRSDLYSVGMVAYEALLGSGGFKDAFPELTPAAAFASKWLSWVKDSAKEAAPLHALRPDIPVPISQFVARLMAKDPDLRYPSVDATLEALQPLFDLPRPSPARPSLNTGPRKIEARTIGNEREDHRPSDEVVGDPTPSRRPAGPALRYAAIGVAALVVVVAAIAVGSRMRRATPRVVTPSSGETSAIASQNGLRQLTARFVDERGIQLADVSLKLLPGNLSGQAHADGTYLFEKLKPGTYELTATVPNHDVTVQHVTVREDADAEETLTLRTSPRAKPVDPRTQLEANGRKQESTPGATAGIKPNGVKEIKSTFTQTISQASQSQAVVGVAFTVVPGESTDLSRRLATRLGDALKGQQSPTGGTIRVSLDMSTRPAAFPGTSAITADYVATVRKSDGTKTFQGNALAFAELTLRDDVVQKAAKEIAAYLATQ